LSDPVTRRSGAPRGKRPGSKRQRLLVIGLDAAAPELVFERWPTRLPCLQSLMLQGTYGPLTSTIPPITVPAWASMLTGRDPGELGIYGFRNRRDHTYAPLAMADARQITFPRVWDILGRNGCRVGVFAVPPSYPVRAVNGHMVGCFLTPPSAEDWAYPTSLRDQIVGWLGDELMFDVANFRSADRARILDDIYRMTKQHFSVCRRLLEQNRYDFFMMVEIGVDRIQHAFWNLAELMVDEPATGRFEHAIRDYYVFLDAEIETLLDRVDSSTAVLVVSDHGAKPFLGGIRINEWLISEGYLTLDPYPTDERPLEQCSVDWRRTRAWAEGGYYARVFMNLEGREPEGSVAAGHYEAERNLLKRSLEGLPGPDGERLTTFAHRPEDIYRSVSGLQPDLMVEFGDLDWRALGSVGSGVLWTGSNDSGPDRANHSRTGLAIFHDPANLGGGERRSFSIYEIAPLILNFFGLSAKDGIAVRGGRDQALLTSLEDETVVARLRDLGYV
jgi:predicted AlkP superfamily phosphohydrolase/phosphomutase